MTIYENSNDRVAQHEAVDTIRYFLNQHPFHEGRTVIAETKEGDRLSWDFEVFSWGLRVGVGEVKCRNLTREQLMSAGWLIDADRLNALYKATGSQSRALDCMFVIRTQDDCVLYTMLHWLVKNRDELKDAPEHYTKDDHGSKSSPKRGLIVPPRFLRDAGEIGI